MSHVALTGGGGFLGWHTRAALLGTSTIAKAVRVGAYFDARAATEAVEGSSRFLHIAGVNRGTDFEVREGNLLFARQAAESLRASLVPPPVVVFANSSQSLGGGTYGEAKAEAAAVLANAASEIGARFVDVILPNLFGEHGRPFYNAVTSTFSHLLAEGREPTVTDDREMSLLHVQDAADLLLGVSHSEDAEPRIARMSVSVLLARLRDMAETYRQGEIPDVSDDLSRNLFNTYRSYTFPTHAPFSLARHMDSRGSFFEIVRSHGGSSQSSFSTTGSGISRGDHFHRRKIERFTVLSGQATISLRKVFTKQVIEFAVTGDAPVAIDMPTMWAHKITNTGSEPLYTSFWTSDIFNPELPDTIPEAVSV